MLSAYCSWVIARLRGRNSPSIRFYDGITVSSFASFSEFWLRRAGVSRQDIETFELVSSSAPRNEPRFALDIGANLGAYSLAMAKAGFDRVYAFEPIPETYARLLENLDRNSELSPRIVPLPFALASQSGSIRFEVHPSSPGQNKIARTAQVGLAGQTEAHCDATTIDAYLSAFDQRKIALLKIDVEGFECDVLRGGSLSLKSGRVLFIYSEVIPEALEDAGSSLSEFEELLSSNGFEPVLSSSAAAGSLVGVPLREALGRAGAQRNILFRHRSALTPQ